MTTSSTIHSAAFNFLSHAQTGVDPRTGQYTCTLSLPDLNANDLAGPALPLSLGFSPLNGVDSGFGLGWTLQLSQYDTQTNILALSTGETFKVTGTNDDQLVMEEKKLDSFHLYQLSEERFRVVHKSGLVEELSKVSGSSLALPETIYSAQGRLLRLTYVPFAGERLLKSIAQADGTVLLDITRQTGSLSVRVHPNMPYEALFRLVIEGSEQRVARIELPDDDSTSPPTDGGSWRFTYERLEQDFLCINRVEGPLGGFETIDYDSIPHFFPGPENRRLPRVARHIHNPGSSSGQPPIETRYQYSDTNFLGRNAPGLSWENNGLDNLYKVVGDYLYHSTEELWDPVNDKAMSSTKRTFNRFHLMVDETTAQGDCRKQVATDYYAEDDKDFQGQVAYCQMPRTVTTTWWRESDPPRKRIETVSHEYDFYGNSTVTVQANGIREESTWYPANGGDGCPPDPHGFVRHLKDKTVIPADAEYGEAPVLRTVHRYTSLPPVSGGSEPWLAPEQETLVQVDNNNAELQRTLHHYISEPGNSFQHGRIAKTEVVVNGMRTYTDFFYSKTAATRSGETVLRTVEILSTSFDEVKKTVTREQSLLNGQPLLERDENDVEIAYRYDKLGRVVEETVSPDPVYAATRTYEYVLVNRPDQQASQTATDAKGVKTRTLLDGMKRVVKEERQDVDGNPVTKPFRPIYEAKYNAFGQMIESVEVDWLQEEDLFLRSSHTYDDWGEQDSTTGPDGVTNHSVTDPIRLELHEWRDGMGKVVTRHNLFEKPESVQRFDLAGKQVSEKISHYDGLGRTHHEIDELQHFRYFQYDAHGRMTLSGLPDGAEVVRRYAGHSTEELPVWIGVGDVQLGEQTFDGLGRLTQLTVGPRTERYNYEGGHAQARERITPSGHIITYEYLRALTDKPVGVIAEDEQASYTYDHVSAQLNIATNGLGQREFDYDSHGHLLGERWIEAGQTWTASHRHSQQGRLLNSTDVNGLESTCTYDQFGRLQEIEQGSVRIHYTYDALSRPYLSTCEDLAAGSSVSTTLEYDDWGQETLRTLKVSGQPDMTITQGYRLDGRLQSRHQQSDGQTLLQETFEYDERGRLTLHQCSGSQLPVDRYGNAIVEQDFVFDALDNLRQVTTRFADGSDDLCVRTFADDEGDPCRLVHLTHSHVDYPKTLDLDYDADGRLLFDENGQGLAYDTQGRLLQVSAADGTVVSRYHYDAHNQLAGTTHAGQTQARLFYQGDRLNCTVQGANAISYLHDEDRPLSQQQRGNPAETLLLLSNASRSIIAESQQQTLRTTAYDAYGQRSNAAMQCHLAFNGELRDRDTGWYLLGNGYRAYNPWLMCFHSPDSASPFGAGGINPWMYCAGDPINFRDPSGHMPRWLSWTFVGLAVVGMVFTGYGFFGAGAAAASGVFSATFKGFMASSVLAKAAFVTGGLAVGTGVAAEFADPLASKGLRQAAFVLGLTSAALGAGAAFLARENWLSVFPRAQPRTASVGVGGAVDDLPQVAGPASPATPAMPAPATPTPAPQPLLPSTGPQVPTSPAMPPRGSITPVKQIDAATQTLPPLPRARLASTAGNSASSTRAISDNADGVAQMFASNSGPLKVHGVQKAAAVRTNGDWTIKTKYIYATTGLRPPM